MTTHIPRRLTPQERAAVGHLLRYSALGSCAGTEGRIVLDGHDLTIRDLSDWGWSSGEDVLIQVLLHLLGDARMPELSRLDDSNRKVITESLRLLGMDAARLERVQAGGA